MKLRKIISIFGLIVGGGIFVLVLGIVALVWSGDESDESGREYVAQVLPSIFGQWSPDALISYASPELIDVLEADPASFERTWQHLSRLGPIKSINEIDGQSTFWSLRNGTRTVTAGYLVDAQFTHAQADVNIKLKWVNQQWKIQSVNIQTRTDWQPLPEEV